MAVCLAVHVVSKACPWAARRRSARWPRDSRQAVGLQKAYSRRGFIRSVSFASAPRICRERADVVYGHVGERESDPSPEPLDLQLVRGLVF